MIDLACPSCGRAGQVPREKLHTRLVCRKCHVVFHVEPSGRPVLGEPVSAESKEHRKHAKASEHHSIFEGFHVPSIHELTHLSDNLSNYTFPVKPVLGGLGALVVAWVAFSLLNGPGEPVTAPAQIAAEALVHDDLERLKLMASDKTRDDVVRWYDAAHSKLESARKSWPSKEASIQVLLVEENQRNKKGEVEVFLVPARPSTQTASVLPAANAGPTASKSAFKGPLSFHLHWVLSGGHWQFDAHQSLAVVGL